MDREELEAKLSAALQDAQYWRSMYDKLLQHIQHQSEYIAHLENQIWGSR